MRLFRKKKKKTEAELRNEIEEAVLAEIKLNVACEIGGTYRAVRWNSVCGDRGRAETVRSGLHIYSIRY